MLERGDLLALHEPFYNLVDHGETDVADQLIRTTGKLIAAIRSAAQRRTVFFKDTTDYPHTDALADARFVADAHHAFPIRPPEEIAGSREPVVIDPEDFVSRPAETMAAYCRVVGLLVSDQALRWEPGQRVGVAAQRSVAPGRGQQQWDRAPEPPLLSGHGRQHAIAGRVQPAPSAIL